MRKALRRSKEGFALVELMIVVAIVGILAVLAIYGVRKYIANAKTTEARNSLGQISKDAISAYEKEAMGTTVMEQGKSTGVIRKICATEPATGGKVPTIADVKGAKYQSKPADWTQGAATNSGFACLHFSMDQPQYYVYGYTATSTGADGDLFTATAEGDLNGDGTASLFSIGGKVQAGTLNVAPSILEQNSDE